MKKKDNITFILAAIAAVAITLYIIRQQNTKKILAQVANEGYETAADILFPGKKARGKLHYGPVLPK